MNKKLITKWIFLFAFFLLSLFFVEEGIAGSHVVAQYNNGYGTFDMVTYDAPLVDNVLSGMSEEGITVYKWYYFFDFIFIIGFGLFQCALSIALFRWCQIRSIRFIVCVIPILRGLTDVIENVLLLITLSTFPNINAAMIQISSACTGMKLLMVKLWILEFAIGIIGMIITKLSRKRK